MRFVVIGVGAVGGVVGGRLAQHGQDVLLVARGAQHDAIAADGLLIRSPDDEVRVRPPVVDRLRTADVHQDDVVLLAVKGQDTQAVLAGLPRDVAIACLQNGVDNERQALRHTERVYAVPVMLPATYLVPGVVETSSAPIAGLLDVGRYPIGIDDTAVAIAAAFDASGFSSIPNPTVMRFKWTKLLMNLANALEAACGPLRRDHELGLELYAAARAEGEAVLAAAGIDRATDEEDRARRGDLVRMRPIDGERRGGGSSWQSLARGTGTIEVDQLNGEIVLLGRLHGVPTPVNALLQQIGHELAASRVPPGSLTYEDIRARLAPS
jgi:2-dehydropantoate 2-reductase